MKVKFMRSAARPAIQESALRLRAEGPALESSRLFEGCGSRADEYENQNHGLPSRPAVFFVKLMKVKFMFKNEVGMNMCVDYEKMKSEIRCRKCNRLLMKGEVRHVEIKCPKCGFIQEIGTAEAEE